MEHRIVYVEENSIGQELGIEKGDVLLSVNGQEIGDVFDWRTLTLDETVTLLVRKPDGEEWELEIEKEPYEDIGLSFESDLMSDYIRCSNACIFCFIDQMPPGMRETLYFKDDDSRLSFLQGNYITLTNMKPEDVRRIIRYRMEPMNISVHTTNPELRVRMLKNRFAGKVLSYLEDFYEAGIRMNGQIVLCKGYNDGAELERTVRDLMRYAPVMESLSIVPVGLTKYREGLAHLDPFTEEDARRVTALAARLQREAYEACGIHFVHASDEFYFLAGEELPAEETYDDYPQLENGVGMSRLLLNDAARALENVHRCGKKRRYTFATGELAAPLLEKILKSVTMKFPGVSHTVRAIRNDFFGPGVTVAGLVTGKDLIAQLEGTDLGEGLFLPNCMFRSGEEVFLDDVTRTEAEQRLGVPVYILKNGGETLVRAMCGRLRKSDYDLSHGLYEIRNG
ncbi:MAG: DUF512 domain-containing protein [Lachnospiraceae bacterium]|nr:DUF512 domain-containing protein [Lachnospiraceae bacterium]